MNEELWNETSERYKNRTSKRHDDSAFSRSKGTSLLELDQKEHIQKRLEHLEIQTSLESLQSDPSRFVPTPEGTQNLSSLALERIIGTNQLTGITFLMDGAQVSRSVGRIRVVDQNRRGYGTGFLVSPSLLLTNNHVLANEHIAKNSTIEFDYFVQKDGEVAERTTFELEPQRFFLTNKKLDFTLVAVSKQPQIGRSPLNSFGWLSLDKKEGKIILGEYLNIIQHPNGEPKQVALRQNQLVDQFETFLHYKTDTEPGSSGSPVFNDQWEVVGLHHSGVPKRDDEGRILTWNGNIWTKRMGEHRIAWIANEGIRIHDILGFVEEQKLEGESYDLRTQLFETAPEVSPSFVPNMPHIPSQPELSISSTSNGLEVNVPIEVNIRIPTEHLRVSTSQLPTQHIPSPDKTEPKEKVEAPQTLLPEETQETNFRAPLFECFALELADTEVSRKQQMKNAKLVASQILGPQWKVEWYSAGVDTLRIAPGPSMTLTVSEAWELVYRLQASPQVHFVEPLFEVQLPTIEEEPEDIPDDVFEDIPLESSGSSSKKDIIALKNDNQGFDWAPKNMNVFEAWEMLEKEGKKPGEGIIIAHPDTGYTQHPEIDTANLAVEESVSLIDGESAEDTLKYPFSIVPQFPGHGTAIVSVIVSPQGNDSRTYEGGVTGIAPDAKVIPIKMTRTVILLSSDNLVKAIYKAVEKKCHVISMSLGMGWATNALLKAIRYAISNGVMVFSASGNYVPFVVYPAGFNETIAVAGCDHHGMAWKGSSRGDKVDVTAPGHRVWCANAEFEKEDNIVPGSGTSFAVAETASVAALWLTYHGRDELIKKFGKGKLQSTFKKLLKEQGCDPHVENMPKGFGVGRVNAEKVLSARLPDAEEVPMLEKSQTLEVRDSGMSIIDHFQHLFPELTRAQVRRKLMMLLDVSEDELPQRLKEIGPELLFHMVLDLQTQKAMMFSNDSGLESYGSMESVRKRLMDTPLSRTLLKHLAR